MKTLKNWYLTFKNSIFEIDYYVDPDKSCLFIVYWKKSNKELFKMYLQIKNSSKCIFITNQNGAENLNPESLADWTKSADGGFTRFPLPADVVIGAILSHAYSMAQGL